jgi:hypothetical protein
VKDQRQVRPTVLLVAGLNPFLASPSPRAESPFGVGGKFASLAIL